MSGGASGAVAELFPTIVFVAHAGPLEAKAALLGASLADFYRPGRIVCRTMAPHERWGAISPEAQALFDRLGIAVRPAENEIDPAYPHGNKVGALLGVGGRAVFLDSDILLMCPFTWHHALRGDAAAKPADLDSFAAGGGRWEAVWNLFDLKLPPRTMRATVSGERMRPYYNAGCIVARDGDALARMWVETARAIDAERGIVNKRPWLDQVALPVALARLGWQATPLGDAFNYPCHLSPLRAVHPYFAHYHWPRIVGESPPLLHRVAELVRRHPELAAILARDPDWAEVTARLAGAGVADRAGTAYAR